MGPKNKQKWDHENDSKNGPDTQNQKFPEMRPVPPWNMLGGNPGASGGALGAPKGPKMPPGGHGALGAPWAHVGPLGPYWALCGALWGPMGSMEAPLRCTVGLCEAQFTLVLPQRGIAIFGGPT